jgi:hypothetical protein
MMDDTKITMMDRIIAGAINIVKVQGKNIDTAIQMAAEERNVNADDYDWEHIWKAVYYEVTDN